MGDDESMNTPSDINSELVFALMTLRDMMGPVLDEVKGYKEKMIEDGYSDHIAERMAADFHAAALRVLLK